MALLGWVGLTFRAKNGIARYQGAMPHFIIRSTLSVLSALLHFPLSDTADPVR